MTIIDTHVTTIVSSLFLFVFGTAPIRGFAVTLVLGLLANLFSAVYVSRTIFIWLLSRKREARRDAQHLKAVNSECVNSDEIKPLPLITHRLIDSSVHWNSYVSDIYTT